MQIKCTYVKFSAASLICAAAAVSAALARTAYNTNRVTEVALAVETIRDSEGIARSRRALNDCTSLWLTSGGRAMLDDAVAELAALENAILVEADEKEKAIAAKKAQAAEESRLKMEKDRIALEEADRKYREATAIKDHERDLARKEREKEVSMQVVAAQLAAQRAQAEEEATRKAELAPGQVGEQYTVGYFSIQVIDTGWSRKATPYQTSEHMFLHATIELTNNDNQPRMFTEATLVDQADHTYSSTWVYVEDGTTIRQNDGNKYHGKPLKGISPLDKFQPGVTVYRIVFFDVPKKGGYDISLGGGYGSIARKRIVLQ